MNARESSPIATLFLAVTAFLLSAPVQAQAGMLTTTGTAAQVIVLDAPTLVPPSAYTIEAWFYLNPAAPGGSTTPTILRKNPATLVPSYMLRTTSAAGGNLEFYAGANGTYYVVTSSVPTPINSWHHVAGTHDGLVARLFLDGVQVGSTPVVGPPLFVAGNLEIADGNPFSADSWRGSIDEIRLWSVAKTAAEIQTTMFAERDDVPNLVSAWHFNGNFLDTTGTHHGTPNSQVAIQPSTSPVLPDAIGAPITATIGGPLVLTVMSSVPGLPYIVDVSVTGNSPGIYIPPPVDKTLPLNPPLLHTDYGSFFPQYFTGFLGFIGANQQATATLNLPPLPSLVGSPVWASFVLLDPSYPLGLRAVGNGTVTTLVGPAPVISSVFPQTTPVAGGSVLVVNGANFVNGATVMIGTASATNVVVLDSQTISCVTPPGTLGPKPATVTNPDAVFGTLANAVTYVPNLVINSVSPLIAAPGQLVTISGSGFVSGLSLTVGGIAVVPTAVISTIVTFFAPSGVPCHGSVVVTNPDGQTQSAFWNPPPAISQTIGASGPAAGGGTFSLVGTHFSGAAVTVGGTSATILNASPTALFLQAPPGSLGPAPIVVTSVTGCTATSTYTYQ